MNGNDMQTGSFRVILQGGQGEYEEKKSRFIATVRECDDETAAAAFIEEMRRKYWDARHNCYAYRVGERGELTRCSDDGEPAQTAGRPILDVMTASGICRCAIVVTRYFGGVLLGTGGLVRAYTRAAQEGLKNCRIGIMREGFAVSVHTDYNDVGKVLHMLAGAGIEPVKSQYTDSVALELRVSSDKVDLLEAQIRDATGGRVGFIREKKIFFAESEE